MAIQTIIDQFQNDITITRARYNELILAEREAEMLKGLIHEKAAIYDSFTYTELRLIDKMFCEQEEMSEELCESGEDDG